MKTYSNLYKRLCSEENIFLAYKMARKGKSKKSSVLEFERNLDYELNKLREELVSRTYEPRPLKKFIVRDPKTRTIHASAFRDRIVHHLIVGVLEQVFDKLFIYDSFASRINKGTHNAVKRFDCFMRKVTRNGCLVRKSFNHNSVQGYVLKADIKKYFETVDHEILVNIIESKINDKELIWLIRKVLSNFNSSNHGKGMPLGNYTSQFFANVYLNELDSFVKYELGAKYYIRYVDDFVILHRSKKRLEYFKKEVITFLNDTLKVGLHPDKSKIEPLQKGVQFLGYRIFYHHKLLRKRNLHKFRMNFQKKLESLKSGLINEKQILEDLQGWFGYSLWANTYKLREKIKREIIDAIWDKISFE